MSDKLNYEAIEWKDNETELSADQLNHMDQGIVNVSNAVDNLANWVKSPKKPEYAPYEVDAYSRDEVDEKIASHNTSEYAHSDTLAPKNHTHTTENISDISNFKCSDSTLLDGKDSNYYLNYNNLSNAPALDSVAISGDYNDLKNLPVIPDTNIIPTSTQKDRVLLSSDVSTAARWSDWTQSGILRTNITGQISVDTTEYLSKSESAVNSRLLNGQDANYYLNYQNLSNKPVIPTKTSQLENDGDGLTGKYVTHEDLYKNANGEYIYPFLTEEKYFDIKFCPATIIIYQRRFNKEINSWTFTASEQTSDYSVKISSLGFSLQCKPGKAFNVDGYNFYWVAFSIGPSGLPEVTTFDNGKVLQVVDGIWQKADLHATFTEDIYLTTDLGEQKLEPGQSYKVLNTTGKTFEEVFKMFTTKIRLPQVEQPYNIPSFTSRIYYEVGETVTPEFLITYNPGKYEFGPDTGCFGDTYNITAYLKHNDVVTKRDELSQFTNTGTLQSFVMDDGDEYYIKSTVHHPHGTTPFNNIGQPVSEEEAEQLVIKSGLTEEVQSIMITSYRKTFYGSSEEHIESLDSPLIRGLQHFLEVPLNAGDTFTVPVDLGCKEVIFAYPATVRDVTSIEQTNVNGIDVKSAFTQEIIPVAAASGSDVIDYKVYWIKFAEPNDQNYSYKVTI